MFRIDSLPGALSYPTAYPAPRLGLLAGVPGFLAATKRIGSPQIESVGTRVSTLGQLPSSYSKAYRYHTVSSVSTAQPWGTPHSALTVPYRYTSGSPYQKSPYVYHQNTLGLTTFPRANYCQLPQEPKPTQSYIGLIAMAILSVPDKKLVLSDIYKYILDHYPYFRARGPGWRNSIRHNLSLNECFIKSSRSSNGKGHFWAVHPANVDDFAKGDFRRRRAQRKVRKYISQKRHQLENNPAQSDLKENDEITVVEVVDKNDKDECEVIDDCDYDNNCYAQSNITETQCETENACDWEDDSEVDVISTNPDVTKQTMKPVQKRGAFDMDTILSTNFPCTRRTIYDNTTFEKKSSPVSTSELQVTLSEDQICY